MQSSALRSSRVALVAMCLMAGATLANCSSGPAASSSNKTISGQIDMIDADAVYCQDALAGATVGPFRLSLVSENGVVLGSEEFESLNEVKGRCVAQFQFALDDSASFRLLFQDLRSGWISETIPYSASDLEGTGWVLDLKSHDFTFLRDPSGSPVVSIPSSATP